MDNIMKKFKLIPVMLLVASNTYADCYSSDGVNLCTEEISSSLAKNFPSKEQAGDINGDGFLDIVRAESAGGVSDRIVVYLGKSCSVGSSLCFGAPHVTSIYPVKGLELDSLNAASGVELVVRDAQDKIRVFSFSQTTDPQTPAVLVSLLGTNNLTPLNYTASSNYADTVNGEYEPAGAFDGYRFNASTPITGITAPWGRYGLGTWTSALGYRHNQWLSVEFDRPTKVASFDLYAKNGFLSRLPKNITLQTSNDGVNYVNHESVIAANLANQTITLLSPTPFAKYFRFYMHDTQSATDYLQVDEILLKGWVQ